ncbi:1025_t:CDS:2 [Ambispora gerdemannii]|uniref:1025_t:CDS:1 n=1 Tax=Ambispora gerdemannii TaxID=144530 RepID=A0A9N8W829_9GLOM|nr:1025_t:CDS:2 [Ambispora gerdemannii]
MSRAGFPPSTNSASIPFMITSTSRQKLYELEYTKDQVDSLSPSQALIILSRNFKPETYGAYIRATYQPKKTPELDSDLPPVIQKTTFSSSSHSTPSSSQTDNKSTSPLIKKGWRKYIDQFKSKPASYIISFAILHEITAILPIPLVYLFLDRTGLSIPLPEKIIQDGNQFINKVANYYGWQGFENGTRMAINGATSYAVVKVLLPVRIAACVWLTPWTADKMELAFI